MGGMTILSTAGGGGPKGRGWTCCLLLPILPLRPSKGGHWAVA